MRLFAVQHFGVRFGFCDSHSCLDVFRDCLLVLPPEKLDEMLAGGQQEVVLRARPTEDFRAATVKQRPTSRRITQAEINVSVQDGWMDGCKDARMQASFIDPQWEIH